MEALYTVTVRNMVMDCIVYCEVMTASETYDFCQLLLKIDPDMEYFMAEAYCEEPLAL